MQPLRRLPTDYEQHTAIDLSKNRILLVAVNLGGLVLFFLFGWLFTLMALQVRTAPSNLALQLSSLTDLVTFIGVVLLLLAVQVILHELIHGFFFWFFTRSRPTFGFKGLYAYAAAPDWYLPRNQHLIVALAPLVLITGVGLGLLPFVPLNWLPALLLVMTANAAGAVGDIVVAAWLLFQPLNALVQDVGDAVTSYHRQQISG